ncbi:MAG TPA: PDZ domain-containing protein [Fimbriimonadaceae bacterium]|nr:PDZ domain-containing protein [Fimbriimonadaceae bacterium]
MISLLGLLVAGPLVHLDSPHLLRYPDVHGQTVVFSYGGDLWVSESDAGVARRLTSAEGLEARPKISPDGRTVAFTASYDGPPNVYTIPIEGGEPKRITYDSDPDYCLGWTPDGKIAFATSEGNFISRQRRLCFVGANGGRPEPSPLNEVSEMSYFSGGHRIAYTRTTSYDFTWRRYRGGTQGRIAFYDFDKNEYSELPAGREQNYFPMVVGKSVYYISSKGSGVLNLFKYDTDSKSSRQVTRYADDDIRYPSTDGQSIVFEKGGELYRMTLSDDKLTKIEPVIRGEFISTRPSLKKLGQSIESISLSPSGVRVAAEARGHIFSIPVHSGDTRDFTDSQGVRERQPAWSPDGKSIAFLSDAGGEINLYVRPSQGGLARQITTQRMVINGFDWSPDGRKIGILCASNEIDVVDVASGKLDKVFGLNESVTSSSWSPDGKWISVTSSDGRSLNRLRIIELATGAMHDVTDGSFDDAIASWDKNGKFLYLVSARSFHPSFGQLEMDLTSAGTQRIYVIPLQKTTPDPLAEPDDEEPVGAAPKPIAPTGGVSVAIDFDGLAQRMVPLPMGPTSFGMLDGANNGVVFLTSGGTLMRFDLGKRAPTTLFNGLAGNFSLSDDLSKLAYYSGGVLGVVDLNHPAQPGEGRVDTSAVEAEIDPTAEWAEIVHDAWRFERDHYYDANMNGLDWNGIGKKYESMLRWAVSRSDVNYILGLMIGELGTGHAYVVNPGDYGPHPPIVPVGYLGADYKVSEGHLQIAKILRGRSYAEGQAGPLAEPGIDVREGDYLLAIDGKPVTADTNLSELMLDKAGRYVTVTVNSSPTSAGARKARVKAIGSEDYLRYVDFVESNRALVDKLSGGKIGYLHVEDTGFQGAAEVQAGFYGNLSKEAVIIDERWNSGGFDPAPYINLFMRPDGLYGQSRYGPDNQDFAAFLGPKVMLVNGYAGSGGDNFAYLFQHYHLGPLIGKRTWGGLIGINGFYNLVDGGSISAPAFAIYDPATDEIVAENHGIDPDIDLDNRPDLVASGHDPQLEEGVKYLLDKLKTMPPRPPRKDLPHRGKDGVFGG